MDSIGLVLFDSIKIRGGGGGVCAHRAGAVGYTLALESVWSKKEGGIGADIPRELTSTLPLAPFPSPLPLIPLLPVWSSTVGNCFPFHCPTTALSSFWNFARRFRNRAFHRRLLLLPIHASSLVFGKGNGTSPFSYSRPRSRSATTRGFHRTYEFRGLFRAIYATHASYVNPGHFSNHFRETRMRIRTTWLPTR